MTRIPHKFWIISFASLASFVHADEFEAKIKPLIGKYCIKCHGGDDVKAGIDFNDHKLYNDVLRDRKMWTDVLDALEFEDMPPEDHDVHPSEAERELLVEWLGKNVVNADWKALADPGRVSMARLTKLEYSNALRDIFGMDLQAGIYLGRDPEGSTGFTNDRGNLAFPLFALQEYLREAERATDAVLSYAQQPWSQTFDMTEEWKRSSDRSVRLASDKDSVALDNNKKPFHFSATLPHDGLYEVVISAQVHGGEPIAGLQLLVDGRPIDTFLVEGRDRAEYRVVVNTAGGFNSITLAAQPEFAPLIQPKLEPAGVPAELEKKAVTGPPPHFTMPKTHRDKPDAERLEKQLNRALARYHQEAQLTTYLLEHELADYDDNSYNKFSAHSGNYDHIAKRVAFFLGLTNDQLRYLLRDELGFDLDKIIDLGQEYREKYEKRHPERRILRSGEIRVDKVTIANLPQTPGKETAAWILAASPNVTGVREVLGKLAGSAWRRPADKASLEPLLRIYGDTAKTTNSHLEGLRDAIVGLLVSPRFLLNFSSAPDGSVAELDDADFAARLTFFLWMSIPDQTVSTLAGQGLLRDPENAAKVIEHMVNDPRFEDFCDTFTEQWLNLSVIEGPSEPVIAAMRKEPALLLRQVIRENRSILELIDSKETWVNSALADHYGLPPVQGSDMRPVPLPNRTRGGLPTMGAVLTATSPAERTSPVARGAWIVETLLGEELPPPPPAVPELKTDSKKLTVREELELHRSSKACSGCHAKIDPYGFVLENYDRDGTWRDTENGNPVDSSATIEDGTKLAGIVEFKTYLQDERAGDFARNLIERLLEFALGREVEYHDEALIGEIAEKLKADGYRSRTLLTSIINSQAFRQQNNTNITENP